MANTKSQETDTGFTYIARMKCGCVIAWVADQADRWTGKSVADLIAAGYTVERMERKLLGKEHFPIGCRCNGIDPWQREVLRDA